MTESRARTAGDAVLLALVSFAVCRLLRQDSLHGDGWQFLLWATQGQTDFAVHFAYMPLLVAFGRLLATLGWSMHEAGQLLSALLTALGTAAYHVAIQGTGLTRPQAVAATSLLLALPSVVYFGTVLELPPLPWCVEGLVTILAVRLARTPTLRLAPWLGLTTGLVYLTHATSAILPWTLFFLARAFARLQQPAAAARAPWLAIFGTWVVVHFAVIAVAAVVLRAFAWSVHPEAAVKSLLFWIGITNLDPTQPGVLLGRAGATLWHEAIWPYLPAVLAVPLAWRGATTGILARAWTLAVLPGLGVAFLILAAFQSEHGEYLQPAAFALAVLVTLRFGVRATLGAAVLSLAVAVAHVRQNDVAPTRAYAAEVRELAANRQVLLLAAGKHDLEAVFVALPQVELVIVNYQLAPMSDSFEVFTAALGAKLDEALHSGRCVLLSEGAVQWLEDPTVRQLHPRAGDVVAFLRERYALAPAGRSAFRGFELRTRPR